MVHTLKCSMMTNYMVFAEYGIFPSNLADADYKANLIVDKGESAYKLLQTSVICNNKIHRDVQIPQWIC